MEQFSPYFQRSSVLTFLGVTGLMLIYSLIFTGCSQHSQSFANKTFHNTTARYNAYFLAREKMKEVEQKIIESHVDDYNKVLLIYPTINEGTSGTIKPDLEYIIEKAALPITKHQNSDWVDDSYNIIGKARLYQKDYKLAVETFKYVNTKGEDFNARHQAMIWLMRTYLDSLQLESATAVNDYLKKEQITIVNAEELFLTRAFYYQIQEDWKAVRENLEMAVPYVKKKEKKARTHFIIGQIYQLENDNENAYKHYNLVFKNNPPYELFFYARLYIAQVSELDNSTDRKKIDKYFRKLLKDQKNLEYRDKIYYEMGKYELKHHNLQKAIKHFKRSVFENKGNQFQKARSYLALGKLYYYDLKDYETSKLYYDSTATTWDPKDKEYEPIVHRQKILEEFVSHYTVYKREDSLQRLSRMDSLTLVKFIDNILEEQKKKEELLAKQEAAAKKAQENAYVDPFADQDAANSPPQMAGMRQDVVWYFYNPSAIAKGRAEFVKKWGKRKLEDNWRRSDKPKVISDDIEEPVEDIDEVIAVEDEDAADPKKLRAADIKRLYDEIPHTPEALASSNERIEEALYHVAKIYDQKLEEPRNSIEKFEEHLDRFNDSEYRPEIYYFLFLINKKLKDDPRVAYYKEKLLEEFPNTVFAKLTNNPNYLVESRIMNAQAAKAYKEAYETYKSGNIFEAESMVVKIRTEFPENDIMDKLSFLTVLIKGETLNPLVFRENIKAFLEQYPESEVSTRANEILKVTEHYIKEQQDKGFDVENEVKFIKDLEKPHVLVCLYTEKVPRAAMSKAITAPKLYKELELAEPKGMLFKDSTVAVVIDGFPDKASAKQYFNILVEEQSFIKKFGEKDVTPFVISTDNYKILTRSGNTGAYMRFFRRNYHDRLIYGE